MPLQKRLLIVDDEPETRHLLAQIFQGMGHDVSCAENGIAALQRIRRCRPDILLSDLNMPVMSGYELLSVVRRRLPEIFVIASSGAHSGAAIPDGVAADAFYEKASGLARLLRIVSEADTQSIAETRRSATVPIWISADESHTTQSGYLAIACPECLRVSMYAPRTGLGVLSPESCIDCRAQIRYAIVDVLPPVNEVRYHAVLCAEICGCHDTSAGAAA